MIPKQLHMYWGGRGLSWLRYLTVKSFKRHNPDWQINVFYPAFPQPVGNWSTLEQIVPYEGENWQPKLKEFATLIPMEMRSIGFADGLPEIYKSDIFRLWALYEYGGLYSDFDILYRKPMPELTGRLYCYHPDGHYSVGLLGAQKGDDLYRRLLDKARNVTTKKYQSYGSYLWHDVIGDTLPDGWNIPKDFVYSRGWQEAESLFTQDKPLPDEAVGIHWYGGSRDVARWENKLNPVTNGQYHSTISNLAEQENV